jgi:MFS family permease
MNKPNACQQGSDEAQFAAAWSNLATSLLSLVFNPLLGSISDVRGRRSILLLGLFLNCIPSAVFLVMLREPTFSPTWYYVS